MKKILTSILTLGVVAVVAVYATNAFFSDVETSTGNTFTAGSIDLQIDNESWYHGPNGLEQRSDLSWQLDDLTGHLFFNFSDIKPGDWGEDTVSIHVFDNDAWACTDLYVTKNDDMSSTEPELEIGDEQEDPQDIMDGELAQNLWFFFWEDDGDNVWEESEDILTFGLAENAIGGLHYALADSQENNVGGNNGDPLTGSNTYYIGKVWCYGHLEMTPSLQDDWTPETATNVFCDGSAVDNWSQTDNVMADISFYAEQSRNNEGFVCQPFSEPTDMNNVLNLENKNTNWNVIDDDTFGTMVHSASPTFHGTIVAQGLESNARYQITLNGPGSCTTTDDNLAGFGANLFQSGYWNGAGPGLSSSCGSPGEGIYNMNLIGDEYTVMTNASGDFAYAFNLSLPSGIYTNVKVLVKKTLDPFVSPWTDPATVHTTNLFETAPITFTVD